MNLELNRQEIGIVSISLAYHFGYGTEDSDTENFEEAANIAMMIAKARNAYADTLSAFDQAALTVEELVGMYESIILENLTEEQVRVILISVNYAYNFFGTFSDSELPFVRDILVKIGNQDSIDRFDKA